MTTRKKAAPKTETAAPKRVTLMAAPAPEDEGTMVAVWALWRYRFMFTDGTTLDVLSHQDDSDLRAEVLRHTGKEGIVGIAKLTDS